MNRYLVAAPETSSNSLGRALSLAEMLRHLGPVSIAAGYDGPLWQGAHGSPVTVRPFGDLAELERIIASEARLAAGVLVVVAVKPFQRSLGWVAEAVRGEAAEDILLVVDLDDHDASIQWRAQRGGSRSDRARFLLRHELSPWQIRRRIGHGLRQADLLTVSSWALRTRFPSFRGPELRVPHPRSPVPYRAPKRADRLRIGFLGTPQQYKGIDILGRLMSARPDLELHVLAGMEPSLRAFPTELSRRVVAHPHLGQETLRRAFEQVDAVVLPQDPAFAGARWQLPAKAIDALCHGRPIVATATPPIVEVAGVGVLTVSSWRSLDEGLVRLDELSDRTARELMGRRMNRSYTESLSAPALAHQFATAIASVTGASLPSHGPQRTPVVDGGAGEVRTCVGAGELGEA